MPRVPRTRPSDPDRRHVYASSDGLPLVYAGAPPTSGRILTVADHIKWYDVFTITSTGKVHCVPQRVWTRYYELHPDSSGWVDHVPSPLVCKYLVTAHPGWFWDSLSLEVVFGRWVWQGAAWPTAWSREPWNELFYR